MGNSIAMNSSMSWLRVSEIAEMTCLGRQYIEGFYNPRRRQSGLGYNSPAAFEAAFHANENQETTALQ